MAAITLWFWVNCWVQIQLKIPAPLKAIRL